MSEMAELGYPEGYHMGLSAILWWIYIIISVILSIILYLKAKKSDLINVKEMLRSKSFVYICYSIGISLIQVGVFYPDNFSLFLLIHGIFIIGSLTIYFHYWEKHLTSIKRIPTICMGASSVILISGMIIYVLNPNLVIFILDFLVLIVVFLYTIAFLFYIYLIFKFSKYVKGVKTSVAWIWMLGVSLGIIVIFIEYPPGVTIIPSIFVFYINPLLFTIPMITAVYGITTLFSRVSSYYAQTQKCAVHRGIIDKGTTVYYCPSCGITYCESCFNQVIKKDGCWNCRYGVEVEIENEWEAQQAVEVKKGAKSKHKSPK